MAIQTTTTERVTRDPATGRFNRESVVTGEYVTRKDNTTLWTVIAIIVIAALAYVAYVSYYGNYGADSTATGVENTSGSVMNNNAATDSGTANNSMDNGNTATNPNQSATPNATTGNSASQTTNP